MGGLFVLNDSEQRIYWKKNIFKIETFIFYESLIICVLSCVSYLTFPFYSLKLINKNFPLDLYVLCCILFSLTSFICSFLIKNIHLKNNIKPNYRLCLMNFFGTIGFFCTFLACGYTLCISFVLIEWENLTRIVVSKRVLSSKSKSIEVSISRAIFTLIWNHIVLLCSSCCFIDFAIEIIIIAKASKYLSEGNNINNQNLLHELFKMTVKNKNHNSLNSMNTLDTRKNINKKETFSKFRIIMNDKDNTENSFENENNKFREVEIIQKVDYKSIGVQTEDNIKDNFYNNYIHDSNNRTVDEDLSNNCILIRNKPLIDSKISIVSNS
jgi:hypothetical protein